MTTQELKALMALASVNQADIAEAMFCSQQAIAKIINRPASYPIRSQQIHLLLTHWAKNSGYELVKTAA